MSKPDWSTAPSWAQFVAMDQDGSWWWHAAKPVPDHTDCLWSERGNVKIALRAPIHWASTLEPRP